MYLIEALKYDVPAFHEDRLTQIIAATFNESALFRRYLFEFLDVPARKGSVQAKTQVSDSTAASRPDLVIFVNESPYILIESKVDAVADLAQQNRHQKVRAKYNFLIARDPIQISNIGKSFRKITWFDFFGFLVRKNKKTSKSIDSFLLNQLIRFGQEFEMLLPDKILKKDIENACLFFTQTRLRKFPRIGFSDPSPFKSLENISQFFERVILKLKEDPVLEKATKGFTRRIAMNSYYDLAIKDSLKKDQNTNEMNLKTNWITLEKDIQLKRKINGFSRLFIRIEFIPHFRNKETTRYSLNTIKKIPIEQISYRAEIIAGVGFSDGTYSYQDCVYFEKADLDSFSLFYREASKHWKKELS